ncbi:dipeptide epimerase [Niveispirillum fermenti]|uniref:dipeptide epimerase n=1 Tax=Niveispirillum fermenti TaxID=1233113 RepID=UPI003A8548FA
MHLATAIENWPFKEPIRITGYTFTGFDFLVARLSRHGRTGRGEATGVYYRQDTPPKAAAQLSALTQALGDGLTRQRLRELLPPGCARNALDAALWELLSLESGRPVWELAGLAAPRPLVTTHTLGAERPEVIVATTLRDYPHARALKLKLTGEPIDADRVRAIRHVRPDAWIGVDANQGFTPASLGALLPTLLECGVGLIEQPFPIGREADLEGLDLPIPVAADESVQSLADLPSMPGRFDIINIKLDKCGGMTEGLLMAAEARRLGLGVMVGNMVGTTLAMAPAFLLGQLCDFCDLDGPLALAGDRDPAAIYEDGHIFVPEASWGASRN